MAVRNPFRRKSPVQRAVSDAERAARNARRAVKNYVKGTGASARSVATDPVVAVGAASATGAVAGSRLRDRSRDKQSAVDWSAVLGAAGRGGLVGSGTGLGAGALTGAALAKNSGLDWERVLGASGRGGLMGGVAGGALAGGYGVHLDRGVRARTGLYDLPRYAPRLTLYGIGAGGVLGAGAGALAETHRQWQNPVQRVAERIPVGKTVLRRGSELVRQGGQAVLRNPGVAAGGVAGGALLGAAMSRNRKK